MMKEFVEYVPAPEQMVLLYEKLDRGETLELEWKNPGRRPPTPVAEEKPAEAEQPAAEADNKDFDFDEDFGEGLVTPQRRNPGSALKGSARKLTTSLDGVLSSMKRHREIEEMDDDTPTKPQ